MVLTLSNNALSSSFIIVSSSLVASQAVRSSGVEVSSNSASEEGRAGRLYGGVAGRRGGVKALRRVRYVWSAPPMPKVAESTFST